MIFYFLSSVLRGEGRGEGPIRKTIQLILTPRPRVSKQSLNLPLALATLPAAFAF
jgi:hypothetical protein